MEFENETGSEIVEKSPKKEVEKQTESGGIIKSESPVNPAIFRLRYGFRSNGESFTPFVNISDTGN